MKVLLDAYFDNNFGDDLFLDLLLKRYPEWQFYVFWKKKHPNVLDRATKIKNLVIMPDNCILQCNWPFDAYIMIGGDVLPDGVDYNQRISWMKYVKQNGGFVAMLGFSLYEKYGSQTIADIKIMSEYADSIVARDRSSAERFRAMVIGARVIESADMAFTAAYTPNKNSGKAILGLSPRRKLYSQQKEYDTYCDLMALIADGYLTDHSEGEVYFFAFSTGEYDDRVVAENIIERMNIPHRTKIVSYTGNTFAFIQELSRCDCFVTTRFHSLVFALIFGIPFVPVIYEVKITQLLNEINYEGKRILYGVTEDFYNLKSILYDLNAVRYDRSALNIYQKKAELFFSDVDNWIKKREVTCINTEKDLPYSCILETENENLKTENEFLKRQVMEYEKWVEALKQERNLFEKQNLELEEIRQKQWEHLQQVTEDYTKLDELYQTLLEIIKIKN